MFKSLVGVVGVGFTSATVGSTAKLTPCCLRMRVLICDEWFLRYLKNEMGDFLDLEKLTVVVVVAAEPGCCCNCCCVELEFGVAGLDLLRFFDDDDEDDANLFTRLEII